MANFGQSFADSFSKSFAPTFAQTFQAGTKRAEEKRLLKLQQEADTKLADSFKEVDAQNQDRIGGVQALSEIRTIGNLPPAARKAMIKGRLMEMESSGIKPSEEFKTWLSSSKPDEFNAVMDLVFEGTQKDPGFGRQKLIETISDPAKFRQVLAQTGTEANKMLQADAAPVPKNAAMLKSIGSEMTQEQANINRLQSQRNKLMESVLTNPLASNAARKAVEIRINQIDNGIKQSQDRIKTLDSRAFDLETKDTRTLRKFIGPDGERNIWEMKDGTFLTLDGQPFNPQGGLIVPPGTKSGQSLMIETPDGTVIMQGEAGDLTKSQQGKQKMDFTDKRIATRQFVELSNKVIEGALETPEKLGFTGFVSRIAGEVKGIASNISKLGIDTSEVSKDIESFNFGNLAGQSAEFKNDVLNLALIFVAGSALGKGGRVSDKDVQIAIDNIGASTNDVNQLVARLSAQQQTLVNGLKIEADEKKIPWEDIPLKDFKRTTPDVPEGIDPKDWEFMTPEERKLFSGTK